LALKKAKEYATPLSSTGHHRLVEPLLDIAAEAVRGQVGEVEGLYRHRCQDLHGPSAAVDLHHQRTERLIVFGAQRRQVSSAGRQQQTAESRHRHTLRMYSAVSSLIPAKGRV
jgi:hypothetical protein